MEEENRIAAAERLVKAAEDYLNGTGYRTEELLEELLWETLVLFQGCSFYTAKKLEFQYTIKRNEMFVSRKNKSITRATVNVAFWKLLELGCAVSGPKKLGTFGASYVYAVFLGLGLVRAE